MKLNYDKKSKDPTYFIQQGYRNGSKTSTRNVKRIGKHSELLKITDDPLAYAQAEVSRYNEEMKSGKVTMEEKIDFGEKVRSTGDIASSSTLRSTGYFFIQNLYHDLRIHDFFESVTADSKITFDPDEVNRFLTYARILDPDSKLGTFDRLDTYYEQPDFQYQHILRTMDIMSEHYDEYISHLYKYSEKIVKRNTSVCYFDCSNFYCEVETDDDDYEDPVTHETIKGLRKYGPSKEHRPNPIVEMGLFMDGNGIPLSMCITSGSDNEQTLAIPEEKRLNEMFKGKKFIYCADGGLGSYNIRSFNSVADRAYVVTQSVKKLSDVLKQAVFNDCDYRLLSSNERVSLQRMKDFDRTDPANRDLYDDRAYKIINADRAMDTGLTEDVIKNGRRKTVKVKTELKQHLIITFSRKMMEYQRYIRNRQIERAKKLLKNLDPDAYKKGPNDVTRFIRRTSKAKDGSQATDTYVLDMERIAEEEKYDGFYAIATNLYDDAKEIIAISEKRNEIEDCFRVMKTNFSARPIYHRTRDRIKAHFLICYTALLIYRLMEIKLNDYGKSLKPKEEHYTTDQIIETLRNLQVADVNGMYYLATYQGSQVLDALNGVFQMDLDKKYYLPKELNKKIKKISH